MQFLTHADRMGRRITWVGGIIKGRPAGRPIQDPDQNQTIIPITISVLIATTTAGCCSAVADSEELGLEVLAAQVYMNFQDDYFAAGQNKNSAVLVENLTEFSKTMIVLIISFCS